MKFKLIALLLGLAMAIPGAVSAQISDDQLPAEDLATPQGSYDQGSSTSGPYDQGSSTPAPAETNAGAARISLMHGQVSTQRGDTGDWSAAALNAPMVAGDKISTGDQSRAEVQLDYANILRLSEHSQANIGTLSQKDIQVQLGQGLSTYTVFGNGEANVELDTPNASVHPGAREGSYRILVVSDNETDVVVRRGEAEIATPQGRTRVGAGQSIVIRGTGNDTSYRIAGAPLSDDWDRWISDRDHLILNAQGRRHTNRYYVGSEDLDAHGSWRTVPDYGQVWAPDVDSGWAPYRDGNWVWEPGWGWTWVSYEPWGWAPYHYGRWFMYDSAWVWWPGPVYGYPFYRPLWAPAYVSFFGFGGGFGFGFGSFGWLPIGPCDAFFPWWGPFGSRFNVINVTNITTINNFNNFRGGIPPLHRGTTFSNLRMATTNDRVRSAISTVNARDFGHGRVTAQPVSREAFRNGRMMAGNLPVAPTRASLSASGRAAAPSTVPAPGRQPAHFFGRTPASANRQSFDREAARVQSAIRQNGRSAAPANENRPGQMSQGRPDPRIQGSGSGSGTGSGTTRANSAADWRRSGQAPQMSPGAQTHGGPANSGSPSNRSPESWRNIPRPGTTNQPGTNSSMSPASRGSAMNTQGARQMGNQNSSGDWRHSPSPRPAESNPRGGSVAQPNSPTGREPAPNPSRNDGWRTLPRNDRPANGRTMNDRPTSAAPINRGQSSGPSDNGNWRRPSPRQEPQTSRPPLDMRRPIVTPRSSGPSNSPRSSGPSNSPRSSGPGYSPRSSGPGYSAPRSSGPSYSAPRYSGPSYSPRSSGPGYSAPRSSGPSYSAPRSSGPSYSAPRSSAPSGRGGSSGNSRSSGSGSRSAPSGHHG